MEFYGRNDITLGGFLEIYCFRYNTRFVTRASSAPEVKMPYFKAGFPLRRRRSRTQKRRAILSSENQTDRIGRKISMPQRLLNEWTVGVVSRRIARELEL